MESFIARKLTLPGVSHRWSGVVELFLSFAFFQFLASNVVVRINFLSCRELALFGNALAFYFLPLIVVILFELIRAFCCCFKNCFQKFSKACGRENLILVHRVYFLFALVWTMTCIVATILGTTDGTVSLVQRSECKMVDVLDDVYHDSYDSFCVPVVEDINVNQYGNNIYYFPVQCSGGWMYLRKYLYLGNIYNYGASSVFHAFNCANLTKDTCNGKVEIVDEALFTSFFTTEGAFSRDNDGDLPEHELFWRWLFLVALMLAIPVRTQTHARFVMSMRAEEELVENNDNYEQLDA